MEWLDIVPTEMQMPEMGRHDKPRSQHRESKSKDQKRGEKLDDEEVVVDEGFIVDLDALISSITEEETIGSTKRNNGESRFRKPDWL